MCKRYKAKKRYMPLDINTYVAMIAIEVEDVIEDKIESRVIPLSEERLIPAVVKELIKKLEEK